MKQFFASLIKTFPFLAFWDSITDFVGGVVDDVSDFFGGVGDDISDSFGGVGDFFETVADFFTDTLPDFFTSLPDKILNSIVEAIKFVFGYIFYLITKVVCWLVELLYNFFKVFAGLSKVSYKGKGTYLINVFFDNSVVNRAYWGIAVVSFVLIFAFAIAAVIRKFFDVNEKQKEGYGQIIINSGKAFLIILLMTIIMSVALTTTNLLMQTVSRVFQVAGEDGAGQIRYFTTEEYAHMNHAMEVIGNSSLNPSYTSRYNINSCFNRIRPDLVYLQSQGIFNYDYSDQKPCWQYTLQQIAKSGRLSSDLKMDVYYESVTLSITNAMNHIKQTPNFRPAKSVSGTYTNVTEPNLAVVLFLTGTSSAAKNYDYNVRPGVTDAVRGPYYSGAKSIYSYSDVSSDFDIKIGGISYTVIIILSLLTGWQLLQCILACAVRIFNMLLLYIVAPPFAATYPLDGGVRFRNWTQAFVIQCFSVFGTVIAMRLLIMYIPIVMSGDLVIFNDGVLDLVAKAVLIFAGTVAAARAPQLFSGILTGNGAQASAGAGDMSSWASRGATFAGGTAAGFVGGVTGATALSNKISKAATDFADGGGLPGAAKRLHDSFKGANSRSAQMSPTQLEELKNQAREVEANQAKPSPRYMRTPNNPQPPATGNGYSYGGNTSGGNVPASSNNGQQAQPPAKIGSEGQEEKKQQETKPLPDSAQKKKE